MALLVPLACHAYDETAYESETREVDDGGADATADGGAPADASLDASADALAEAGGDDDGAVDAGDSSCAPPSGAEPCSIIPELGGPQDVDGTNAEFCGVPYLVFRAASDGQVPPGSPPFPSPAPVLTLQVAWNGTGLAVFAHVDETDVSAPPDYDAIYQGDAIELFVAASSASLTGNPDGGDPGTFHFILAPTSDGGGAMGKQYVTNGGNGQPITLQSSTFVGKLVPGGYDLEATFPWANFGGAAPAKDAIIGFDFAVDIAANKTPDAGPDDGPYKVLQSFFNVYGSRVHPPSECNPTEPEPFCDDRTWCTPQLE